MLNNRILTVGKLATGIAIALLLIQTSALAVPLLLRFWSRQSSQCQQPMINFGRTHQDNRLALDPCSLHKRNGRTYFTYYLDGRAIAAKTYCNGESKWMVRATGAVIIASSDAARRLLSSVCQ